MARANTQESKSDPAALPAAPSPQNVPVAVDDSGIDYAAGGGAGMEGAGQEAFAIPFLAVLQKGSPQVDEDDSAYVKGAKAGMLYETVSGRLYDGREGALIVPCAYKRAFLRWGPRDAGGFRGELAPEDVAAMRAAGTAVEVEGRLYVPMDDGSVNPQKSDRISEVRNHFCLLVDTKTLTATQVLLSLTSTQIKKSKALMSMLSGVRVGPPNNRRMPDTFANLVRLTTVPESNDKGSWYGVKFELAGLVGTLPEGMGRSVYEIGREFNKSVARGAVAARYDEAAEHDSAPSPSGGGAGGF